MRYIILFFALTISNLCTANEDLLLSRSMDSLVEILSDTYSSEFSRNVYDLEKNYLKAVFFTIEGFGRGNNWQRYLAIFQKSIKTKQVPPFEPTGEEKYRLIGYLLFSRDHAKTIDEESFTYKNRKITIPSISLRSITGNQKIDNIVIKINAHSLEKFVEKN